MNPDALRAKSRAYYEEKLRAHGPTARGVDWNSEESQHLRFRELARLFDTEPDAAVLDYGCGTGALGTYLRTRAHRGDYVGFDVSPAMIDAARTQLAPFAQCRVTADAGALAPMDYTVASGLFNVKQDAPDASWQAYVRDVLAEMRRLSLRGFGFNVLTIHSDPERRRGDLYYADPLELFEHCRQRYSRHVALLHDYQLFEFTILVRL